MEVKEESKEAKPAPAAPKPQSIAPPRPVLPVRPAALNELNGPMKLVLIIVCAILLLVAVGAAVLLAKNSQSTDDGTTTQTTSSTSGSTANSTQSTAIKCAGGTTAYTNQDIGFGFCYPSGWGAITVIDAKLAAADTGKRLRVNFATKPAIHLNLTSQDWTTKASRASSYTSKDCTDLGDNAGADYPDFSTDWKQSKVDSMNFATRGVAEDSTGLKYLIRENVQDRPGVCLWGITFLNGTTYAKATASYYAAFDVTVKDLAGHIATPDKLISAADRAAFAMFVQSVTLQ